MSELIDAGVNLTSAQFDDDLEDVIQRATDSGVVSMLAIGCDIESSKRSLLLANRYNLLTTAGIHPHDAKSAPENFVDQLKPLLDKPEVVAVGECGLDFNRDFSPRSVQQDICQQQLELANALNMPVYLHEREAHNALFTLLKGTHVSGLLHCFTGNKEALKNYLDYGLSVGITGWLCDERRGLELQELVRYLPLERMLLETDAPYLIPRNIQPKPKTRRNEPAYLHYIVAKVAELKGISAEQVIQQTTHNFTQLFVRQG
ncbi:TatD family hydrolase [Pseudoalteromonas sp. T1lg65]|uniref:TatD family hydrolase n=1 Tax=Pseudoalteromonas sp. T1lg65 TaxID=2077101 RepID=UPI003F7A9736